MNTRLLQATQIASLLAGTTIACGWDTKYVVAAALIGFAIGNDLHTLARLVREVSRKRKG